ncbi:TonB-dependent receptor [Trichocoleus sp. FACHB-591]|uniref:TonB-dependent receptor n=1 Tax=Trichocoleus sp. FACHB-591 TaxID=2692872 RepID=UPI0016897BAF|nr:TonB-dependent receptor [Trichocoleus sp. FACHB-591]MBD2095656.1 TonB-dependent receptor [Trichocoleus sp. FACHB-591]
MTSRPQFLSCSLGLLGVVPALIASPAWAQSSQITNVQLNPKDGGLEVVLETSNGAAVRALTTSSGNTLTTDITNAQLRLAGQESFRQTNPAAGIAEVTVTSLTTNSVRVTIVGESAVPISALTRQGNTVFLNINSAGAIATETSPTESNTTESATTETDTTEADTTEANTETTTEAETTTETDDSAADSSAGDESAEGESDAIRIVATDDEEEGYTVRRATSATRTEAPLRDTPRSVQVVPEQVLEDQRAVRVGEALQNVAGVAQDDSFGGTRDRFTIRGFSQDTFLRNGFRQNQRSLRESVNVERIEVLRGPASVLYGQLEPGGVVNLVTEQPLFDPAYSAELSVGSFGLFRPSVDLTGPVNDDGSVRYRLNAVFEGGGNFRDFDQDTDRFFVAPVLAWDIGDRTSVVFEADYLKDKRPFDRGIVAIGEGIADIPYDRVLGHPDDEGEVEEFSVGYQLEHELNDNWKIRNGLRFTKADTFDYRADSWFIQDSGQLDRRFLSNDDESDTLDVQTNITGKFSTGAIDHTLLVGVDFGRTSREGTQKSLPGDPDFPIDIYNPIYGDRPDISELTEPVRDDGSRINTVGLYLQDQIDLTDNLILLAGGRIDFFKQSTTNNLSGREFEQDDNAFSPQVGLVYQPIEPISLYGSFSRSFVPSRSIRADGSPLDPERGTQYEVGVRGEFLDGRLVTNLAAFELTKTNIATRDPNNRRFSLPVGEVRSRGIELDVTGELAPGWNVIASYANIDAEITKDNLLTVGNRLTNVPRNSGSLWSTYEIQSGNLQGFGFGAGLFFVGDRAGDLDATFELPSYVRTDAVVFYRRDNWRAAINVKNLFDINYVENSEGFREYISPGEPLTIIGSLSVSF